MPTSRVILRGQVGGISLLGVCVRSAEGHIGHDLVLPAAHAGTLMTRTSDTAGWLHFAYDTHIGDGDRIEIYWVGGRRYNVLAGCGPDNDVPFSGGQGDTLPAQDTPIVAMEHVRVETAFDSGLVRLIMAGCSARGYLGLYANSGMMLLGIDLGGREVWGWMSGSTAPNPLGGQTVAYAEVTHAEPTGPAGLQLGILYDSLED